MKKIVTGIVAHVDSGKTTLSEGLLYSAGEIRKRGRVDHGDTFLDTDTMERERGITIFAKQAVMKTSGGEITLLDTPGHVDFSAETERTLAVLDYAVLVISGTEGVQSHTETLWYILKNNNIPVFIFVNKMDISSYDSNALLHNLKSKLDDNCIDFGKTLGSESFFESVAMSDEEAMQSFLESGKVEDDEICRLIAERKIFPCFFGSALKQEGVDEFLAMFDKYTLAAKENSQFGAKVYKISEDEQGNRLTYAKICGGSVRMKDLITYTDASGNELSEKINQIRIYSGNRFKTADEAVQGEVCALLGLSGTFAGQGLGTETSAVERALEPVFLYKVQINDKTDATVAMKKLKKLEEEEPQLSVFWNEQLGEIHLRLMGEVQCEILKRIIAERFEMDIDFVQGSILYKETVASPAEGVGHFEPLRHYAEVHVIIEPGEPGSGVVTAHDCSEDELAKNWQRLIMGHLGEKRHVGVLTGSELTDVKITLVSGKAHLKHTEGGDFRQATYRAVRHALMRAENVLLEPWYEFVLELPTSALGRAMTDIEKMGGKISLPESDGENSRITGQAPVSQMREYQKEVTVYTKGLGHLSCRLSGYQPCANSEAVIAETGYDPEADLANTPDSVFCEHGAGFLVKWDEVENYMHLPFRADKKEVELKPMSAPVRRDEKPVSEEELIKIYEHTYGKIETKLPRKMKTVKTPQPEYKPSSKPKHYDKTYLLVDGYNIIFASDELKKAAEENLELARNILISRLCNYKALKKWEVILVFDAYRVPGKHREVEEISGISVVYTKEAETADTYIEKTSHELSKNNRVQVATSDNLEQIIILGVGALRISASQFLADLDASEAALRKEINDINEKNRINTPKLDW
ncbi:MAG: TetM/TetW/TetO/TetS family tetracycline resistance ribosomal protection protein [Clostridia bacterium]|nr:TetM/TetW/TetO/TetS family tetracycline resistance ribosomal protection protein [Clostridia bacterium]